MQSKIKEQITEKLDNAINEVFAEYQNKWGVNDGGVTFEEAIYLDDARDKLVDHIFNTLVRQWYDGQ